MSLWLSILYENSDWAYDLLSSDLSNVIMIYDLVSQMLDPCSYIENEIEFIEELYNSPYSIITQTVGIYHG